MPTFIFCDPGSLVLSVDAGTTREPFTPPSEPAAASTASTKDNSCGRRSRESGSGGMAVTSTLFSRQR